jgi:hypothetical protein
MVRGTVPLLRIPTFVRACESERAPTHQPSKSESLQTSPIPCTLDPYLPPLGPGVEVYAQAEIVGSRVVERLGTVAKNRAPTPDW